MANMFPSLEKAKLVIPAGYLKRSKERRFECWSTEIRRILLMKLAETFLVRSVPHVHEGVRSTGGERSVLFVKRDGIDRENVFHLFFFRTMTLECVFLLLNFRIRIEEFHRHPTCKSSAEGEDEWRGDDVYLRSNWERNLVCSGSNECIAFDISNSIRDSQSAFDRPSYANPKWKFFVVLFQRLRFRRPNPTCKPEWISPVKFCRTRIVFPLTLSGKEQLPMQLCARKSQSLTVESHEPVMTALISDE